MKTKPQDVSKKLIIALDVGSMEEMSSLLERLRGRVGMFKVGSELFTRFGPAAVREILESGSEVFLDLKFHDIPTTVEKAALEAASLGVSLLDVHALGGREMMEAARRGVMKAGRREGAPLVVAVTLLTHLEAGWLKGLGIPLALEQMVAHLAEEAKEACMDGVVCSAREAGEVRKRCGREFVIVSPGIRPLWAISCDEQRRWVAPAEALRMGADYLVIGRPVTRAPDPVEAVERILEEMESGSTAR